MVFISDIFKCFGNTDAAFIILIQLVNAIPLTREFQFLGNCYIKMADLAVNMNKYHEAISLYHKALETIWVYDEKEKEYLVYDKIGVVYYLLGEINKAAYYHDKGIDGILSKNEKLIKQNITGTFYLFLFLN